MRPFGVARRLSCVVHIQASHFHTTHPRHLIRHKRRPKPLPESWQPYEISRALLELDAFESPYARPYDEQDEKTQREKWPADLQRETIAKNMYGQEKAKLEDAYRRHARPRGDMLSAAWRVDEMDLLTAAMTRPSLDQEEPLDTGHPGTLGAMLERTLTMNSIPRGLGVEGTALLDWMLWRQKDLEPTTTPTIPSVLETLHKLNVGTRKGYCNWRRTIVWILRMDGGPAILHACRRTIAAPIPHIIATRRASRDLISLLNNMSIRMLEDGIIMDSHLCRLGLLAATDLGCAQGMQNYLEMGRKRGHWDVQPDSQLPEISSLIDALIINDRGRLMVPNSIKSQAKLIRRIGLRRTSTTSH